MNSLYVILAVHLLLCTATVLHFVKKCAELSPSLILWMLALPVFGPLSLWWVASAAHAVPPEAEWLTKRAQEHAKWLTVDMKDHNAVPLEEALLFNEPKQRRERMMELLRSDPMENLDLLLLARFNDDPETAHYATATITELQRKLQLKLQQCQIALQAEPDDVELQTQYLQLLRRSCESGLVEGQLLRRQRLTFSRALKLAYEREPTQELAGMIVKNALALKEPARARAMAEEELKRWSMDERSWFDMLRVCVDLHDSTLFQMTMEKLRKSPVQWSAAGRERLQFWMESEP